MTLMMKCKARAMNFKLMSKENTMNLSENLEQAMKFRVCL